MRFAQFNSSIFSLIHNDADRGTAISSLVLQSKGFIAVLGLILAALSPFAMADSAESSIFGPELFVHDRLFYFDDEDGEDFGHPPRGRRWGESNGHALGWRDDRFISVGKLLEKWGGFGASRTFAVADTSSSYTLRIQNGPSNYRRVTAGYVKLNGKRIVDTRDFIRGWSGFWGQWRNKDRTGYFEFPVSLAELNTLEVKIYSPLGSALRVEVVGVDRTPPTISLEINPPANGEGWHNTDATVNFVCADGGTGISVCPEPILVSEEGANQQISGTAEDHAGNSASASGTINLDKTAPQLLVTAAPEPNAAGWHSTEVEYRFNCSDALSGVLECPQERRLQVEGRDQLVVGLVRDKAGNTAEVEVSASIDLTAPELSLVLQPSANAAGWNNTNVTAHFECSDAMSGVASCSEPYTIRQDGGNHEVSGIAGDLAGNTSTASAIVRIDKVPPQISVEPSLEPNSNGWHSQPVTLNYRCSDSLSGVAECPESIDVTEEGAQLSVSASAVDIAGNSTENRHVLNIDQTAPVLAFISPQNNAVLTGARPELKLSIADNLALDPETLVISVDGVKVAASCDLFENEAACSLPADLPVGQINLLASLSDMAGNIGDTSISISTDSDGDGIADGEDLCPATQAGEAVDAEGCSEVQRDDDGDGVANGNDQCPATPTGEAANSEGCSPSQLDIDSDGDGILDSQDQCPSTVPGTPVDATGCDDSQRDTDNDGVVDVDDAFPEDPEESSDLDGDGIGDNSDTDRDGDGVENDFDVFPENPAESADQDDDGIGDNADSDRDGDGVENDSDAFPDDPNRHKLPVVMINSPATLSTVGHTPITVQGVVDPDAVAFTVNGLAVPFEGGVFTAQVSLHEGHNTVVARMVDASDTVSTASISIALDLTPPYITVDSHEDGQVVHTEAVSITGLVNDIVRGTIEEDEATVTVNGIAADIVNRSYQAVDVPLEVGENSITVEAVDQVGNSASQTFTLVYEPLTGQRLELVSGNNQKAKINTEISNPLAVKVLDGAGNPVVDKNVVFRVTQGSGAVGIGTDLEGRGVLAKTDADGIATTRFRLGQRAGVGNQKVRAKVVGYQDEVIFSASAEGNIGNKLSVNSGNNQRGGTHQPLPAPFVVVVTDEGANVVPGARIRFEVSSGGGHFQNDSTVFETQTDGDGRASAHLVMGGVTGLDQQRIKATLLDAPVVDGTVQTITAGFTASAFKPGDAGNTSISGVVMDNQDTPLPGVTIRVDGTTRQAVSDAEGQFKITEVPAGPVHLIADGSTTTVEGEYPALAYNLVTVSGVDNPLSSPIYMVKLNTENAVWAGKEDVELTLPEVPGFKLEVPANSVTFPDGSREGYVSVTVVNSSKVPMTPPNGMQPQFIVTIQPTNALFDPPARLTLPNVDGHTPGAQVEMFSFDHDLEEFVAIGLGTVSEDGTAIRSNPGVGVVRAGWHCGAQPSGSGCCGGGGGAGGGGCPECKKRKDGADECDPSGENCVIDPAAEDPGNCKACVNGEVEDDGTIDHPDKVDDVECKTCKNGSVVANENRNGLSCAGSNPGSDTGCYTCKDGKCGNHCDIDDEKEVIEIKGNPEWNRLADMVNRGVGAISGLKAQANFEFSGKREQGFECCGKCDPETGLYTKESGNGTALVAWGGGPFGPGIGKIPDVYIGKKTRLSIRARIGIIVEGKGEGSATVEQKSSQCEDQDGCYGAGLGLTGTLTGGVGGDLVAGIFTYSSTNGSSCNAWGKPNESDDCWALDLGAKGSIRGTVTGSASVGANVDSCGGANCNGSVGPVKANWSMSVAVNVYFYSYNWSYSESLVLIEKASINCKG
ncbi:thrombospondin type 3 repeat-containing protein [Microbulbifer harenosus]|uniref:Uncharacterized protein n=1 Tax=Microbulbifer harenosus TaxID=2576840 RepID=A0ABY2UJW3_9GAMM|nr:thrombospondin type 3 repeat-containing protein [Microbulbifer harenosus]TLM76537.1 hypothetical protein FDY93_12450 [Microbulbifer harenosus]